MAELNSRINYASPAPINQEPVFVVSYDAPPTLSGASYN